MRTHMVAIGIYGVDAGFQSLVRQLVARQRVDAFGMRHRAHLHQLTMQVQHIFRAGTLVQVVHILRDDIHVEIFFQFHQSTVCGVGLRIDQLQSALIVELVNQGRVASEALVACHVHHFVVFPKPTCVAESGDTALCTHARSSGDNQVFHLY